MEQNTHDDTLDFELDEDGDTNDTDILTMPAEQFAIDYLLSDPAFAEWYFARNHWDAVEQGYDIARKKAQQPVRQPICFDFSAVRNKPKLPGNYGFLGQIINVVNANPGATYYEINVAINAEKATQSRVERIRETVTEHSNLFHIDFVLRDKNGGRMCKIYPKETYV